MASDYQTELEIALAAVRAASQICRRVQAGITPDVLEKKDRSPVTVADFASQAVICRALAASFPDDPVIAEEDSAELRTGGNAAFLGRICSEIQQTGLPASADDVCGWIDHGGAGEYSQRFWTLDPIDGTKGFLRGGQYAVALALIVDGSIQVAVLGCPNLPVEPGNETAAGTVFHAVRGFGSYAGPLDGLEDASSVTQNRVTKTADSSSARFCESVESGHSSHSLSSRVAAELGITLDPVRLDSQAKYATVARGEADIYMRLPTRKGYTEKIWDHAGGVLIVVEAGGKVSDVDGKPLEFHHGSELTANRGVIVTNQLLHESVLSALHRCAAE